MIDSSIQDSLLQYYPMLAELPASQLEEILGSAAVLHLPAETMVFDENQACQGFPLVLSGVIRVVKSSLHGRELQLYRVGPGESCILTSSCLLGKSQYHARGIAAQDIDMVVLPPEAFRQLVAMYEPFRNYVFSLFSERLTDLMQLITAVAFHKLDQRLAALLASRPSPIHATHQSLADELGSVREIVSRLLKNFAEQGWVRLGREQIEVLDAAALKRLAEL